MSRIFGIEASRMPNVSSEMELRSQLSNYDHITIILVRNYDHITIIPFLSFLVDVFSKTLTCVIFMLFSVEKNNRGSISALLVNSDNGYF